MIRHKTCVICEKPIDCTRTDFGSQLCGSIICEAALYHHLSSGSTCCGACGRPVPYKVRRTGVPELCYRSECQGRSSFLSSTDPVFCRVCGINVPTLNQDPTDLCQSPFCQTHDSIRSAKEKAKANAIQQAERRDCLTKMVTERSVGLKPELGQKKFPSIVVLPYLEHSLQPPSETRKQQVAAGFLKIATLAYEMNLELNRSALPGSASTEEEETTSEEHPTAISDAHDSETRFARLNGAACGTCGGKCCNLGGDEALLNVDKFREMLDAQPDSSPQDIVADYMARIPEETFQDSCIFHGLFGCGLTRMQRSITCNTYLCSSLHDLRNSMDSGHSEYLLAATNFRELDHPNLEIHRIKHITENSEAILLSNAGDRILE